MGDAPASLVISDSVSRARVDVPCCLDGETACPVTPPVTSGEASGVDCNSLSSDGDIPQSLAAVQSLAADILPSGTSCCDDDNARIHRFLDLISESLLHPLPSSDDDDDDDDEVRIHRILARRRGAYLVETPSGALRWLPADSAAADCHASRAFEADRRRPTSAAKLRAPPRRVPVALIRDPPPSAPPPPPPPPPKRRKAPPPRPAPPPPRLVDDWGLPAWAGGAASATAVVAGVPIRYHPCPPPPPDVARALRAYAAEVAGGGQRAMLLHGTSRAAAAAIVEEGAFRMPTRRSGHGVGANATRPWMFGRGIYFTSSLQKAMNHGGGAVVVVDVALGPMLQMFAADHALTGDKVKAAGCSSVFAAPRGGFLVFDEVCVYDPRAARVVGVMYPGCR